MVSGQFLALMSDGTANSGRIFVFLCINRYDNQKKAEKRVTVAEAAVRRTDDVRIRLAQIGIDERQVNAAVSWARKVTSKD